jgi:hypothetical protein
MGEIFQLFQALPPVSAGGSFFGSSSKKKKKKTEVVPVNRVVKDNLKTNKEKTEVVPVNRVVKDNLKTNKEKEEDLQFLGATNYSEAAEIYTKKSKGKEFTVDSEVDGPGEGEKTIVFNDPRAGEPCPTDKQVTYVIGKDGQVKTVSPGKAANCALPPMPHKDGKGYDCVQVKNGVSRPVIRNGVGVKAVFNTPQLPGILRTAVSAKASKLSSMLTDPKVKKSQILKQIKGMEKADFQDTDLLSQAAARGIGTKAILGKTDELTFNGNQIRAAVSFANLTERDSKDFFKGNHQDTVKKLAARKKIADKQFMLNLRARIKDKSIPREVIAQEIRDNFDAESLAPKKGIFYGKYPSVLEYATKKGAGKEVVAAILDRAGPKTFSKKELEKAVKTIQKQKINKRFVLRSSTRADINAKNEEIDQTTEVIRHKGAQKRVDNLANMIANPKTSKKDIKNYIDNELYDGDLNKPIEANIKDPGNMKVTSILEMAAARNMGTSQIIEKADGKTFTTEQINNALKLSEMNVEALKGKSSRIPGFGQKHKTAVKANEGLRKLKKRALEAKMADLENSLKNPKVMKEVIQAQLADIHNLDDKALQNNDILGKALKGKANKGAVSAILDNKEYSMPAQVAAATRVSKENTKDGKRANRSGYNYVRAGANTRTEEYHEGVDAALKDNAGKMTPAELVQASQAALHNKNKAGKKIIKEIAIKKLQDLINSPEARVGDVVAHFNAAADINPKALKTYIKDNPKVASHPKALKLAAAHPNIGAEAVLSNVAPNTFTPEQLSEAHAVAGTKSKAAIVEHSLDSLDMLRVDVAAKDPNTGLPKKDPKAFAAMFDAAAGMDKKALKTYVKKNIEPHDILNNPELLDLSEKHGFGNVIANQIKKNTFEIGDLDQAHQEADSNPDKQAAIVKVSMKQLSEMLKDPKAKVEDIQKHMDSIAKMDPNALKNNNVLGMATDAKANKQVIDAVMDHKHDVLGKDGVTVQHTAYSGEQLIARQGVVKEQERRAALGMTGRLKEYMMGTSKTGQAGVGGVATSGKNPSKKQSQGAGIV